MKKLTKKKPVRRSKPKEKEVPVGTVESLAVHGLLLGRDELLVFKDEDGSYHVLSRDQFDPKKDYQVIYLTHEDI